MANPPRPAWQQRSLRWSAIVLSIWLLLALVSWLALPPLIKKIAVEQTQEKIGRKLSIGEVSFNPMLLALTVNNVVLYEPDQVTPALSAQQILLNVSSTSLPRLSAILDEVKLVAPKLHLVRLSQDGMGRYNFSDVIDRILAMPKNEDKTYFSLANVALHDGAILFDDKVTGKRIDIHALNIGVPLISNRPRNIDTFVQPNLSMTVNGTPFSLKGRSKPFTSSLDTTLAIDIEKLDVTSYLPFSPVALPVKLASATLSTRLDLSFIDSAGKPQIGLAGDITLSNISVQEKNTAQLLKIANLSANIKQFDVMHLSGVIDQLVIDQPQIWADINKQGEINWSRISAQQATTKAAQESTQIPAHAEQDNQATPTITIHKLSMHDGSINWADDINATPRQLVQLNRVTIDANELSTLPDAKPGKLTLSMVENGHGELGFDGDIAPLKAAINGHITLKAWQLSDYQNYLNRSLKGTLSGQLSGQALVSATDGNFKLSQLGLQLSDLKLTTKKPSANANGNAIIGVKSIALDDANLDLQAHHADARALRIDGLNGALLRDTNGTLNLLALITTPAAKDSAPAVNNATTKATHANSTWQARLATFSVSGSGLSYEDASVSPAQKLRIDGLSLNVDKLSTQLDQISKVSLQTRVNQNGKLTITGQIAPQLKTIALNLDAQNLPIAPFQTYFTDYLNVLLTNGTLSGKGKLALTPPLNKQNLALQYDGSASINNLRMLDKLSNADFLRWRALNLQGMHAKLATQTLFTLEKITLSDFYARAILSDQGKLNLQNILVPKKPDANTPAPAKSTPVTVPARDANAPIIRIGQTILQSGNINYTDNFVKPNYTANMTGMSGTIGSIASDRAASAAIDLQGKIDNDAPLQISGSLNPLFKPMLLDIKATANGVQLPRLTPYSAKYAGYPITKGKLSVAVQYQIENDKLVAQNKVRIEQLSFGDHVDGPSVTKLPVLLAISLLKDRQGNIDLDLPISGSLSDPQFSIGGVILHVLGNLIVKAVTSPFALINSMFGSTQSGELNTIEFQPGSATLSDDIRQKLDTLGYALHQRPGLKIDVMGRVDPAVDTIGLRQELLNRQLIALKRKDIIAKEGQPDADDIKLTEAERIKYLEKVYQDGKFKKPRNLIGLSKSLPADEMQKLIVDNIQISADDLRDLAQRRADLVRNYLQDQSIIAAERIYLLAPKLDADGIKDKGLSSRVELTLQQ